MLCFVLGDLSGDLPWPMMITVLLLCFGKRPSPSPRPPTEESWPKVLYHLLSVGTGVSNPCLMGQWWEPQGEEASLPLSEGSPCLLSSPKDDMGLPESIPSVTPHLLHPQAGCRATVA